MQRRAAVKADAFGEFLIREVCKAANVLLQRASVLQLQLLSGIGWPFPWKLQIASPIRREDLWIDF